MAVRGAKTRAGLLAIKQRRARVAELYLRGLYQHDIALKEGVVQSTVAEDLKAIQAQWKAAAIRDFDAAKELELARLDNLERTYWEAWGRSLQERNGKQRDGDPRFLDGALSVIMARCKVLGLTMDHMHREITVLLARIGQLEALSQELGGPGENRLQLAAGMGVVGLDGGESGLSTNGAGA